MASGTPVAAYPAPGPIDIIPNSGAGKLAHTATEGLREACLEALTCDRKQVRAFAEKFSWRACAEDFMRNLQPYPEPEKTRYWRRLRRLARVRRRPAPAAAIGDEHQDSRDSGDSVRLSHGKHGIAAAPSVFSVAIPSPLCFQAPAAGLSRRPARRSPRPCG